MVFVYILCGILLLLLVIAILRLKFMISYYGGFPRLDIKLGFFTYEDYFEDLDLESLDKRVFVLKKKKSKAKKKSVEGKKMPKISDALRVIRDGLALFLKYFSRYARLDKYSVRINLATDDPAKTALLYGGLSGVVSALHGFALSIKKRSYRDGDIYTEYKPDFYSEKSDIAVDIHVSLRVWQAVVCYLIYNRALTDLKKLPPKGKKKRKGENSDE